MLSKVKSNRSVGVELLFSPTVMMALILFSFEFKLGNDLRWLFFLILVMVFAYRNRQKLKKMAWIPIVYFLICITTSFLFFKNRPDRAMQFLSYGYDNAFHFTLFRGFSDTSWYPKVDFANWFTDFQLFTNGPMGYYALTSFLLHPFTLIQDNPDFLLTMFATFQLLTPFILAWLVFKCIFDKDKVTKMTKVSYLSFSFLIVFCLPTTLLFNGFAPYFFSIVVMLIWLIYDSKNSIKWQKNLTLSLCLYSTSVVTPAPSALLFLVAFLIICREAQTFRKGEKRLSLLWNISPFVLVGACVLWTFGKSSAGLGWRQLLQPGGLQNINLFCTISIFILTSFLILRNSK